MYCVRTEGRGYCFGIGIVAGLDIRAQPQILHALRRSWLYHRVIPSFAQQSLLPFAEKAYC